MEKSKINLQGRNPFLASDTGNGAENSTPLPLQGNAGEHTVQQVDPKATQRSSLDAIQNLKTSQDDNGNTRKITESNENLSSALKSGNVAGIINFANYNNISKLNAEDNLKLFICLLNTLNNSNNQEQKVKKIKSILIQQHTLLGKAIIYSIKKNDISLIERLLTSKLLEWWHIQYALNEACTYSNAETVVYLAKISYEDFNSEKELDALVLYYAYKNSDKELIAYILKHEETNNNKSVFMKVANKIVDDKDHDLLTKFIEDNKSELLRSDPKDIAGIMEKAIKSKSVNIFQLLLKYFPFVDLTNFICLLISTCTYFDTEDTRKEFIFKDIKTILEYASKENYNIPKIIDFITNPAEYKVFNNILIGCPGFFEVNNPQVIAMAASSEECLETLKKQGCDINVVSEDGKSALSCALKYGSCDRIKMLVKHGFVITPEHLVNAYKVRHYDIIKFLNSQFDAKHFTLQSPEYQEAININTSWREYQEHLKFHAKLNLKKLIIAAKLSNSDLYWNGIYPDIDLEEEREKGNTELLDRLRGNLKRSYPLNLVAEDIKEELDNENMQPLQKIMIHLINFLKQPVTIESSRIGKGKNFYMNLSDYQDEISIKFSIIKGTVRETWFYPRSLADGTTDSIECLVNFITALNFDMTILAIKTQFPNTFKSNSLAFIDSYSFTDGYICVKIYNEKTKRYNRVFCSIPTDAFTGEKVYLDRIFNQEILEKLMSEDSVPSKRSRHGSASSDDSSDDMLQADNTSDNAENRVKYFDIKKDRPELRMDDPNLIVDLEGRLV